MYKRKYLSKFKYTYMLPENDDFLCFIDNLFWHHKKHLKLKKILRQHEELLMKNPDEFISWIKTYKFVEKQTEVNVNIKAFFTLIMIELYKRIEEDNVFRGILDESISMDGCYYDRVVYDRIEPVDTITKQIKHFRDACVHKESDKISTVPEFIEHNIEGGNLHLPFTTDLESKEWCFLIGRGTLPFHRLELIIKYTFNYYYHMPEHIRESMKNWEKTRKKNLKIKGK